MQHVYSLAQAVTKNFAPMDMSLDQYKQDKKRFYIKTGVFCLSNILIGVYFFTHWTRDISDLTAQQAPFFGISLGVLAAFLMKNTMKKAIKKFPSTDGMVSGMWFMMGFSVAMAASAVYPFLF
jgi:hypothetical protein